MALTALKIYMWEKSEAISQDLYQILLIRTPALVCLILSQFTYFERSRWFLLCNVEPWVRSSPSGLPVLLVHAVQSPRIALGIE